MRHAVLAVLAVVGLMGSFAISMFVLAVGCMRASRKGYQAGTITAILLTLVMVGGAALSLGSMWIGAELMWVMPAFLFVPPGIGLLLLPRRAPRRRFDVHRVSFPYERIDRILAAFFILGSGATALLVLPGWWSGGLPLKSALLNLLAGVVFSSVPRTMFSYIWDRDRAVSSFAPLLSADTRAPLLFLRAFEREREIFVSGPIAKYQRYSETRRFSRRQVVAHIPLDAYLKRAIVQRIGPFVALGDPQDYFTPAGAVRAYFQDETWMDDFRALADRASGFLVEAGASSNLGWELQYLRQANLHQRLIVIAGHPSRPPRDSAWSQLFRRAAGTPDVPWSSFAATLSALGYEVPIDEPELGSAFGFDAAGRATLLATDADLPNDFVEPIATWLESRSVTLEGVEVACTVCGRQVLKKAEVVTSPFRCQACSPQLTWRTATTEALSTIVGLVELAVLLLLVIALIVYWRIAVWLVILCLGCITLAVTWRTLRGSDRPTMAATTPLDAESSDEQRH